MRTYYNEGVLGGLISFCEGVKNSCRVYGLVDEARKMRRGLPREKTKEVPQMTAMPENMIDELKRIRSLNCDVCRLGCDPMALKFYKAETKSKHVFE